MKTQALGFYKGVLSPLTLQLFFRITIYGSYDIASNFLRGSDANRSLTLAEDFFAGMLAGSAAAVIESPVELFKSQAQIDITNSLQNKHHIPKYRSVYHCAYQIASMHGIRGMFQGFGATLLRAVPGGAAFFGSYEGVKLYMTPQSSDSNKDCELSTAAILTAGSVAGVNFWLFTYPADVIKSRIQTDDPDPRKRRYRGVVDCARQIYREGGLRAFTQGLGPCMLRAVPANAIIFYVIEHTRKFLDANY